MAQITSVTSESLQAKIRELLPSQQGFGEDLQASNVIQPIIDLTAAAEGDALGVNLQTALAFGSQTSFAVTNSNADTANTPGFWRFVGTAMVISNTSLQQAASIRLVDGTPTTKNAWQLVVPAGFGVNSFFALNFDFVIFLKALEVVNMQATSTANIRGSYRQIADVNGNLVNPSGFTPQ